MNRGLPPAIEATTGRGAAIDVLIEDPRWLDAVADIEAVARRAALAATPRILPAGAGPVGLCLLCADDATLRRLNHGYRGLDRATNVLSFAAGGPAIPGVDADEPPHLGDIAVALETVSREASAQGKTVRDHLAHLIVHGILHLAGYDHEVSAEAEVMEALEVEILAELGIGDPYAPAATAEGEERR